MGVRCPWLRPRCSVLNMLYWHCRCKGFFRLFQEEIGNTFTFESYTAPPAKRGDDWSTTMNTGKVVEVVDAGLSTVIRPDGKEHEHQRWLIVLDDGTTLDAEYLKDIQDVVSTGL